MSDRILNACLGAAVGHTLGAPFKGRSGYTRVTFYEPIPKRMTACPVLDAWVAFADQTTTMTTPTGVQDRLIKTWTYREGPSAFGAANTLLGLRSPASGAFANPLEHAGDLIGRSLFWGLVFPANPSEAARWAAYDAAYDRSGEAVRVACALAAATSVAAPGTEFSTLAFALTDGLPPESNVNRVVKTVLQWKGQPDAVRSTVARVQQDLALSDPQDSLVVLTTVLASIANSKDGSSAICSAVGCGGASDQTGLIAGVIASLLYGGMPTDWTSVLGENYVAGHGLRSIDPPKTLSELVDIVEVARVAFSGPDDVAVELAPDMPEAPESDGSVVELRVEPSSTTTDSVAVAEPVALTVVEPEPIAAPPALPASPRLPILPMAATWDVTSLHVEWQYLDGPVVHEGQRWHSAVRFVNISPDSVDVVAKVEGPIEWAVASRVSSFRLGPGEECIHGVLARPVDTATSTSLKLTIDGKAIDIAVLAPQTWYVAGPFVNDDGAAFTKEFPQERSQSLSDHFAGRSGMSVKWSPANLSGRIFDVEPTFQSGSGVVFLCARIKLPKPGTYRVVAAGSPGVIVRIDGNVLVRYQDTHAPVPRDQAPYSASFVAGDETTVVVKLIRDLKPAAPLALYFLDEEGNVADPVQFMALPE